MEHTRLRAKTLGGPWRPANRRSEPVASERRLAMTVADARTWRRRVTLHDGSSTLVIPTGHLFRLEQKVTVNLALDSGQRFRLVGRVVGTRRGRPGLDGAAVLVEFSGWSHARLVYAGECLEGRRQDRRQRQRVEAKLNVFYRVGRDTRYGVLSNLHEGGVYLETRRRASVGERVDLVLTEPGGVRIALRGHVTRSTAGLGGGLGVRLARPADPHRAAFHTLLRRLRAEAR